MSVLKISGLICIIAGGVGVGYSMSAQVGRRYAQLCELQRMAALLMGEITYGNTPMPECLDSVGRRLQEPCAGFLLNLSAKLRELPQETLGELFFKGVEESFKNSELNKNDLEMLVRMGNNLGYLDREMQLRTLHLFEEELKQELKDTYKSMWGKKKLYQTLGIMGGLFLVILLL